MHTANKSARQFVGIISFSGLLLLTGCGGELSYKRGATGADFQDAKRQCETGSNSATAIDQCLQEKGWITVSPSQSLIGRSAATISPESVVDARIPEPDSSQDPLEMIEISSWWKMGAGPEALMQDGQQCVNELGEGHETAANMSRVTRGVMSCMGQRGWYALTRQD